MFFYYKLGKLSGWKFTETDFNLKLAISIKCPV